MIMRRAITVAAALAVAGGALTGPAWAYVDGPPTLCKIYQSRSVVTGAVGTVETSAQLCLYDFTTERPVLYQTVTFKGNESWDSDYIFSSCSIGYAARDSRGYTITSGTTTIPGPIPGGAYWRWTFSVYRYSNLSEIKLTSLNCNRVLGPKGLFNADLVVTAGTPTRYGNSLLMTPVSLRNTDEDAVDVNGVIELRRDWQTLGVAPLTGTGCTSPVLRFAPGETKNCYFVRPTFTTNSMYPGEPDTYGFQGTRQILPPQVVSLPTVRGTPRLNATLTGTEATLTGDTWGYVNWYRCTGPVSAAGQGEPPSQCTSMGDSVKLTYKVRSTDIGKYLLMKDNKMNLAGELDTYSRTIGPIRRK